MRLGCLRGGAADVKAHAWFNASQPDGRMNWDAVYACSVRSPFLPPLRDASDTSNFDVYPNSDGDTARDLSPENAALFAEIEDF
jgi:hypothetical protein